MSVNKVAIVGFTGRVAKAITSYLLRAHPNIEIHGIARSVDKVDANIRARPNVKVFEAASTDTAALRRGLAGTSVCICCYLGDNTLMLDGQKVLIDACIAENVPRYIASDWTIDFRSLNFGDHPSKDPMKHVQVYLEEKESEGEITGVHILNGAFMEVIFAPFTRLIDAVTGTFTYFGTGDEPVEMTTYRDAAEFTAEVAIDPTANGFLNVLGDRKSYKEMAQIYKEVYNSTPEIQQLGSLEDLRAAKNAAFKATPENPFAWMGLFYQYYMLNGSTLLGKLDNDRYPSLKPVSVTTFMKTHSKEAIGNSFFI